MTAQVISNVISILFPLQATAIVFLNGIVWFLFLRCKRLRKTSNYFLMSLTAAHLVVGILAVPLYVLAQRYQVFLIVSTSVFYYGLCAGILNMYLVTYERYLAILRPLQYNPRMRQRNVLTFIILAWTVPLFLTTLDVLFRTLEVIKRFSFGYTVYHWLQSLAFVAIAMALTVLNIVMLRTAQRQLRSIQATQSIVGSLPRLGRARRMTKATIFFLYIVGTFFIFWTPRIGCDIYELIRRMSLEHTMTDHVTLAIALLNSILDPIIYLFFSSDFKSSIRYLRARRRNRVEALNSRPSGIQSLSAQTRHSSMQEMSTTSTTGTG